MTRRQIFLEANLLALLVALGFPPLSFWPFTFLGLTLLLRRLYTHRKVFSGRDSFWYFGFFSFSIQVYGFYWIAYTFREFGGVNWFLAILLGLAAFTLFSAPAFVFGAFWPRLASRIPDKYTLLALAVWVAVWDLVDFRVFPWNFAQVVGADPWLLATVPVVGSSLWSLILLVLVIVGIYLSLRYAEKALWIRISLLYALFFLPLYLLGYFQKSHLEKSFADRQPVALIQGNVGNYEKKLTKLQVMPSIENVMSIHRDLIEKTAIRFSSQDLDKAGSAEPWIFWPETSFPGFPLQAVESAEAIKNWVLLTRGLHVVGSYEQGEVDLRGVKRRVDFNIAALFHDKLGFVDHYQKRIRVPFGEYIPGDIYFPQAYDWFPAVNHFGAGADFKPLAHPNPEGPVFIPLICYEILFESYVDDFIDFARKKYPGRELIIVNLTNDSWYGPTSEPFIHSLLSRWAAARHGLPLLRPTNTGISQVVAPWGEVMATGPRDESWVIFGELPVRKTLQQ